jgi:hypothetical protein
MRRFAQPGEFCAAPSQLRFGNNVDLPNRDRQGVAHAVPLRAVSDMRGWYKEFNVSR